MSDASSLRQVLSQTDGSALAIQNAASKMMRHYDKSPQVAVTEWRNSLQNCRPDQLLPLLYVANEVLQNSKRNRGNKFLEAYSPILGQALIFICQRDPSVTEKVRRTTKIWGDRRVFSTRFVGDLLQGLDKFRNNGGGGGGAPTRTTAPKVDKQVTPDVSQEPPPSDDDDDDMFGEEPSQHLELDIDIPVVAAVAASVEPNKKKKRRLSSTHTTTSTSSNSTPPPSLEKSKRRRRSILSTASLIELWNQTAALEQSFRDSQAALGQITPQHLNVDASETEQLVGDELLEGYKSVVKFLALIQKQRRSLHGIASERKSLETEAVHYIPFLQGATAQDEEDLKFCALLKERVETIKTVHGAAKAARNARVESERAIRKKQQEALLQKQQEEERARLLENALSKETECKPGMVWNKAAGEYQYPNTEEQWRD